MALASRVPRYSDAYTPAVTPIGIAKIAPSPVTMSDPTMPFAMPPPVSPGGTGICVKNVQLIDESPCFST